MCDNPDVEASFDTTRSNGSLPIVPLALLFFSGGQFNVYDPAALVQVKLRVSVSTESLSENLDAVTAPPTAAFPVPLIVSPAKVGVAVDVMG